MSYKPYNNETTRSSVLEAIRDSSAQEAWTRFFNMYAGFVFAIARQYGLMPDEADDVVQSVMLGLVSSSPEFVYDRNKGSFRSWLGRLARWRAGDRIRKRTPQVEGKHVKFSDYEDENISQSAELESIIDSEWRRTAIGIALERLRISIPMEHFQVFHASVIDEWPTEKVVSAFGIGKDNVYQIRKRVKTEFGEILQQVLKELDSPGAVQGL